MTPKENSILQLVGRGLHQNDPSLIADALKDVFTSSGVQIDRLQLPLSALLGFRHPLYVAYVVTFEDAELNNRKVEHSPDSLKDLRFLRETPYAPVVFDDLSYIEHELSAEHRFSVLNELRADDFVSYAVIGFQMLNGGRQFFSVASRQPFGCSLLPIFAKQQALTLAFKALYSDFVAHSLATAYLGARTGQKVFSGEVYRGAHSLIDAGVAFCDSRGFTAMSERLGVAVVEVVNEIFDMVSTTLFEFGGEVLKFIGEED